MTVRLSLSRPAIHLAVDGDERPVLSGMRTRAGGRGGFGIPEAGRRRASVPQT